MGKQEDVINMMYCSVDDNSFTVNTDGLDLSGSTITAGGSSSGDLLNDIIEPWDSNQNLTCWNWWQNYYYPYVVKESYPIYIREKSYDEGKKAYEIIKVLRDKGLIKVEEVKDFVRLMDELIKLL